MAGWYDWPLWPLGAPGSNLLNWGKIMEKRGFSFPRSWTPSGGLCTLLVPACGPVGLLLPDQKKCGFNFFFSSYFFHYTMTTMELFFPFFFFFFSLILFYVVFKGLISGKMFKSVNSYCQNLRFILGNTKHRKVKNLHWKLRRSSLFSSQRNCLPESRFGGDDPKEFPLYKVKQV